MFNKKLIIASMTMVCTLMMTSCGGPQRMTQRIVPTAVNTINSVGLSELNLKHGTDYTIVNTVTAEATIIYTERRKGQEIILKEENNEFKIVYTFDSETERRYITDFDGVARFGFLTNDDFGESYSTRNPEYVARNLAIYRLINQAKVRGGDGVIEPVVSSNVEQRGKDIVFRTTASAKLIKLKTDAK